MADAYFELDLLQTAEDIYRSIATESLVLNTEVALQLFALYIEKGKMEEADAMIKNAVILNPDYPNVTNVARAFFEERKDWDSAVELTVNEAIRTRSLEWFKKLHTYIKEGKTKSHEPAFFRDALYTLNEMDQQQFEQVVAHLWENYRQQQNHLQWLEEINELLLALDIEPSVTLSQLYGKDFINLLGGGYDVAQLQKSVPHLLTAWQKVTDPSSNLFAASALLAWNDVFPRMLDRVSIQKAEQILERAKADTDRDLLEESKRLFQSLKHWASDRQLDLGEGIDWMFEEAMDAKNSRIALVSASENDKDFFNRYLLGVDRMSEDTLSLPVLYTSEEKVPTDEKETEEYSGSLTKYILSNVSLQKHQVDLLELPVVDFTAEQEEQIVQYLKLTSGMIYILDKNDLFTKQERNFLLSLRKQLPNFPIQFVIKDVPDLLLVDWYNDLLDPHFKDTDVFCYMSKDDHEYGLYNLLKQMKHMIDQEKGTQVRLSNSLSLIRQAIKDLLQQQEKVEKELAEAIELDEATLAKLSGSIHQLYDIEEEKVSTILQAYRLLKDEIKADLLKKIPELIKGSAEIIKEDSDFGKIHLKLNEEMNERIASYLQETVMPIYFHSLQEWINYAEGELNESQEQLIEWSNSFNLLIGEERLRLECDFQVLADWQRDADRMATGIQIDEENILLKRTPAQVLLKSAGKLFGVIPTNNAVMYKRYKSFIENENYEEATDSIVKKFFRQFELFEKAIPRDITLFFREPISMLKQTVNEMQAEVEKNKQWLDKMKAQPELFRDPIKLFDIRMRQIEYMAQLKTVKSAKTETIL